MEWNLRDRLRQAEAQRRLAAGLPIDDVADATVEDESPPPPPVIDLTDPSHVLTYRRPSTTPDATTAAERVPAMTGAPRATPGSRDIGLPVWQGSASPARSPRPAPPGPGATRTTNPPPAGTPHVVASKAPMKDRCPACHGKVRLVRFDLDEAHAHMECTECGFTYTAKSPKL